MENKLRNAAFERYPINDLEAIAERCAFIAGAEWQKEQDKELLEALEAVISVSDRDTDIYNKAKAVIKKAKGE